MKGRYFYFIVLFLLINCEKKHKRLYLWAFKKLNQQINQIMNQIRNAIRESKTARWVALAIVAFTMLCGYYLTDVMAPLKGLLEQQLSWNSEDYGFFTSAYGWFNVFLFFLIIGGIILDKMGVRFTGMMAAIIMVVGVSIKYWAVTTTSLDGEVWDLYIFTAKAQVFVAGLGYAIFGVGVEIAGITVSKTIVKWFKGKEMALAMGLEMATARIGTGLAIATSLPLANHFGSVSMPVLFGLIMACIGLIAFFFYTFQDKKLDAADAAFKEQSDDKSVDESFKMKDIWEIIANKGFWYIAILCVLFYSAVFPFLKYATDLMIQKFNINEDFAGLIPALLPFGTIILTPFFGNLYDRKGKGATIMIIGAIMLIIVHSLFSIPGLDHWLIAIILTIILGIAFSLVPSAMWPSVPKIIPERQLGTAYSLIFWVQNWGLMGVPLLIGWVVNNAFVGYVALVGTGFVTEQGDMINQVIINNEIVELNEPGMVTRIDSTFVVDHFEYDENKNVVAVVTTFNETIDKDLIPDNRFSDEINFKMPIFSVDDKVVDGFITDKGVTVSKYSNVTSYYNYTNPMLIFTAFGVLALLFAFLLKIEDKKKGYGLEKPNIEKLINEE